MEFFTDVSLKRNEATAIHQRPTAIHHRTLAFALPEFRLSEIPEYLRDGALYRVLAENSEVPEEVLTFDSGAMKQNPCVANSHYDCDFLLTSLRFYEDTAAFFPNHLIEKKRCNLAKCAHTLRMIRKPTGQPCDALESGCVEVVKYLLKGKSVLFSCSLVIVHQRGYSLCILDVISIVARTVLHWQIPFSGKQQDLHAIPSQKRV